jgi:hypothetical protein
MSNLSIRVVFQTQFLENYGAHAWDGEGECPQRWKPKGGSTYIVSASAAEVADSQWWDMVTKCISHSSEYSAEYVISETVVDAIDFVESDHVEEWEEPTYAQSAGDCLHCTRESKSFFDFTPVAKRTWIQFQEGDDFPLTYVEYEKAA